MDEAALSEKFEKAKKAEELEEQKKKHSIEESNEKRKNLEKEIMDKLANWEDKLPSALEVIDEMPFLTQGESYYLLKKANEKKICVVVMSGKDIKVVQRVSYFKDTFAADDEVLRLLNDRIPGFIEYLSTQV